MATRSTSARLVGVQVGQPATRGAEGAADPLDQVWTSAIFKTPVVGPVWLGRTNLEGDRQGDLKNHGGLDKAALMYGAANYAAWHAELGWPELGFGGFGENFTVDGLMEGDVCIGDTFAIGDARVQVSQPRAPCWKLERRWRRPGLEKLVQRTGRTGWYVRVLEEGRVAPEMEVVLLDRPCPEWTVTRAASVMQHRHKEGGLRAELGANEYLAASWRAKLRRAP